MKHYPHPVHLVFIPTQTCPALAVFDLLREEEESKEWVERKSKKIKIVNKSQRRIKTKI